MAEFIEIFKQWFFNLGEQYGVNPIIFGTIYVGAIPFFTLSVAWLVRNYRQKRSIVLPALTAAACFVSAYVYLIIAGRNVPWWVYVFVVLMLAYGTYATYRKIGKKIRQTESVEDLSYRRDNQI